MLCKSCGADISNDLSFCPYCGSKILKPVQPNNAPDSTAPSQNPANQMPTNPMPPNQMPPNQMPTNPMPSNQMPWGQMAQNMQAPNQSQPRQMPPYQPQGQQPPGQFPPYMMPQLPPQAPNQGKKSKALPIFLIVGALIFILICVIGAIKITDYIKTHKASEEVIKDPVSIVDNTEPAVTDIPEEASTDTSGQEDTSGTNPEDVTLSFKYTYSELPDVMSIDTDSRFSYQYYTTGTGTAVYTFLFNDTNALETDFNTAVNDYTNLLVLFSGFSYDENINNVQLDQEDDNTTYYSKDNFVIAVTPSVEATGMYAYITIVDQNSIDTTTDTDTNTDTTDTTDSNTDTSTDTSADTGTDTDTYTDTTGTENFYYYIGDREYEAFSQYTETIMDNGLEFYLNDIYLTDMGDGTSVLECSLDLSTTIENFEMYADDFLVIAYDIDGNMITDALTIESIEDSNGNPLTFPNIIDSDYYNSYKVTFTVPTNTDTITFYGTNIELSGSSDEAQVMASGPIYYMEIVFE